MLVVTKTAKVSVSGVGLGLDHAGLGLGLGLGLPGLDNVSGKKYQIQLAQNLAPTPLDSIDISAVEFSNVLYR